MNDILAAFFLITGLFFVTSAIFYATLQSFKKKQVNKNLVSMVDERIESQITSFVISQHASNDGPDPCDAKFESRAGLLQIKNKYKFVSTPAKDSI